MAITVTETQVQWSAADSVSVASGGNETSDSVAPDPSCFQAKIELKADNDAAPASGDTVDFYILETLGDPDGSGANEYATAGHAQHLATLDTNDEDPAIIVVWLPAPFEEFYIYAENDGASAITVSATLLEHRSS